MFKSQKVAELCRRWNSPRPLGALLNALNATFPHLDSAPLPIDPYVLAKMRGIRDVIDADIESDGYILLRKSGYIVHLNKLHTIERKRFTLAHEIGHTFFLDLSHDSSSENEINLEKSDFINADADTEEEQLCNVVAAEILMPRKQFVAMIGPLGIGAQSIIDLANAFRTSIRATARRLIALCPYRMLVCAWKENPATGAYETQWIERKASLNGGAQLSVTAEQPGYQAFHSTEDFRGRVWMSLGGPVDHYFIDKYQKLTDGRIITVIILERYAEKLVERTREKLDTDLGQQQSLF